MPKKSSQPELIREEHAEYKITPEEQARKDVYRARLRNWFLEKDWAEWADQIAADSASGKLDFLIKEALDEKSKYPLKDLYLHRTASRFWQHFYDLPDAVQSIWARSGVGY